MEQKLKKFFSSYASTSDSMKQKEFENFIKVNKIYDEKEAGEIYKNYKNIWKKQKMNLYYVDYMVCII